MLFATWMNNDNVLPGKWFVSDFVRKSYRNLSCWFGEFYACFPLNAPVFAISPCASRASRITELNPSHLDFSMSKALTMLAANWFCKEMINILLVTISIARNSHILMDPTVEMKKGPIWSICMQFRGFLHSVDGIKVSEPLIVNFASFFTEE